ncbi:MAG: ABC transporter permease [Anaerolineae bacterium]|nr:ABC transporter permease [Anaerolineae bacterium]
MLTFVLRRLVLMVPMLIALSIISFTIIQLPPGDYLSTYVNRLEAMGRTFDQEEIENLKRQYGLDQPMFVQYLKWMQTVFQGTFGRSLIYEETVADVLGTRLPMTIAISLASLVIVWALAIPIAIISATRHNKLVDYVFTFLGFIGLASPSFLLALVLGYLLYLVSGSMITGLYSQEFVDAPWSMAKVMDLLSNVWFPVIIIGIGGTAGLIRTLRATLLDELHKPYVTTARAKGLSETRLLVKYPIRIAMNPVFSTIGWVLPGLINGGVIVGIVLNLQTIGPVLMRATLSQDMYLAGSIVLILSTLTIIGTFISDILLAWLDPRIRFGGS